jgi:hypothetical protein
MRSALALSIVCSLVASAAAAPPRGKRTARPKPTHVLITDGEMEVGAEVPAEVLPGVQVSVKGGSVTQTPSGKVKATLIGDIELSGTLPGTILGERLLRDVELFSADGKQVIGKGWKGAFVQARGKGPKGKILVDTVGQVSARAAVDAAAVGPDAVELVLADTAGLAMAVASEDLDLYPAKELKGTPRAKVKKGAQLVLIEELGEAAHVKTYGEYELEGWTFGAKVGDAGSTPTAGTGGGGATPSHEVFIDTPLYLSSEAKKAIGTLRGGTLVGITQKPEHGRARVRTLGDVHVEGWVKAGDLDELESSVWREE